MPPRLRVRRRFWRVLAPKWAHDPLSGAGAALHGGRWNEKGQPALYLSEDFATAVAEYEQELGFRPGTLCAYEVDVKGIVDLCNAASLAALGVAPSDLLCPWQEIAFVRKARPPSWSLMARLRAEGAAGVRVPSVQLAGVNLVLWRWNDRRNRRVTPIDPLDDLPRDQRSWSRARK